MMLFLKRSRAMGVGSWQGFLFFIEVGSGCSPLYEQSLLGIIVPPSMMPVKGC